MDHKLKVKAIIDRNLRDIILKLSNSKIGFISVNKVEVTNDLSIAKVYVSFLNEADKNKSFEKLEKMTPYIRHELSQKISLYKTPEIRLVFDERFIIDQKMDELLKKDQDKLDKMKKNKKNIK